MAVLRRGGCSLSKRTDGAEGVPSLCISSLQLRHFTSTDDGNGNRAVVTLAEISFPSSHRSGDSLGRINAPLPTATVQFRSHRSQAF